MDKIEKSDLSFHTQDDLNSSKLIAAKWKAILASHPEIEFVWLQFILFEGTIRLRMVPVSYFTKMIENDRHISIASAYLHALRNDGIAESAASTGAVYLAPDICTAAITTREASRVRILANLIDHDKTARSECVRSKLFNLSEILSHLHGFYLLVGYEIEVIFFRREDQDGEEPFVNHKCSSMTFEMRALLPMIESIVINLQEERVALEQYHSELSPGQWEFVLQPQRPLDAVDTLVRARDIISRIAEDFGYRATLHPRPFPEHGGTGAHVHISVNSVSSTVPLEAAHTDPFFAGVIHHLPSLMAFCLPLDVSYERVATGIWSGGEFVSWGWQNKETALRRIADNRFELKLHCGMANPYVSLAAILAAGLDGLNKSLPLVAGHCEVSPAEMSEKQREELGIRPIPRNLQQSINHLNEDQELQRILGEKYTATYIDVTMQWNKEINEMGEKMKRRVLLQSY